MESVHTPRWSLSLTCAPKARGLKAWSSPEVLGSYEPSKRWGFSCLSSFHPSCIPCGTQAHLRLPCTASVKARSSRSQSSAFPVSRAPSPGLSFLHFFPINQQIHGHYHDARLSQVHPPVEAFHSKEKSQQHLSKPGTRHLCRIVSFYFEEKFRCFKIHGS